MNITNTPINLSLDPSTSHASHNHLLQFDSSSGSWQPSSDLSVTSLSSQSIIGDLIPAENGTQNIGSFSKEWDTLICNEVISADGSISTLHTNNASIDYIGCQDSSFATIYCNSLRVNSISEGLTGNAIICNNILKVDNISGTTGQAVSVAGVFLTNGYIAFPGIGSLNYIQNGTYDISFSGPFDSVTGTVDYFIINNHATLTFPTLSVTGNNNSASISFMIPIHVRPVNDVVSHFIIRNNSSNYGLTGMLLLRSTGNCNIYANNNQASFTASTNQHGFYRQGVTYCLA